MAEKERKVNVVIREMFSGEEAEQYILGASFGEFQTIAVSASVANQVDLVEELVGSIAKCISKKDDEMLAAGYVALVMHALENIGEENMKAGLKLYEMAKSPKEDVLRAFAKLIESALGKEGAE